MKTQIQRLASILLVIAAYQTAANAWVSTPSAEKEFKFRYKYQQETLEVKTKASTYELAFERAAQNCFDHFKAGRRLAEDTGLDIIDVCANPRSI